MGDKQLEGSSATAQSTPTPEADQAASPTPVKEYDYDTAPKASFPPNIDSDDGQARIQICDYDGHQIRPIYDESGSGSNYFPAVPMLTVDRRVIGNWCIEHYPMPRP